MTLLLIIFSFLGSGSYSKVRIGYSETLGKNVAVKQIDLRQQNEYIRRFMPRELKIITKLKHRKYFLSSNND